MHRMRKGTTAQAVPAIREFLKKTNAEQHRTGSTVLWTMEEIPGVYSKGGGWEYGSEWEVSLWDQRDPLELLKQLEGWGIVEKRLFADN